MKHFLRFFIAIMSCALFASTHAGQGGLTDITTINRINVDSDNNVYVYLVGNIKNNGTNVPSNPVCTNGGRAVLVDSGATQNSYKEIYLGLLSAYHSGSKISLNIFSNCLSTGGGVYPQIRGFHLHK